MGSDASETIRGWTVFHLPSTPGLYIQSTVRPPGRHRPPGHPADIVGAAMSPKAIVGRRPAVGALTLARQLAAQRRRRPGCAAVDGKTVDDAEQEVSACTRRLSAGRRRAGLAAPLAVDATPGARSAPIGRRSPDISGHHPAMPTPPRARHAPVLSTAATAPRTIAPRRAPAMGVAAWASANQVLSRNARALVGGEVEVNTCLALACGSA